MILYERFAAIQLVEIMMEAIFVNAILDFLTLKKMETAWTWTSVRQELPSVHDSRNAKTLLVHTSALVLLATNLKPKKLMIRKRGTSESSELLRIELS